MIVSLIYAFVMTVSSVVLFTIFSKETILAFKDEKYYRFSWCFAMAAGCLAMWVCTLGIAAIGTWDHVLIH